MTDREHMTLAAQLEDAATGAFPHVAAFYRKAAAALREQAEARFKMRPVEGYSHSTACAIWGDDGRGSFKGEPANIPCNCGMHWNWAQRMKAERDTLRAEVERLNSLIRSINTQRGAERDTLRSDVTALRSVLLDARFHIGIITHPPLIADMKALCERIDAALADDACNSAKCGEYNMLRCCRERGHEGAHNYVLAAPADDYPWNRERRTEKGKEIK